MICVIALLLVMLEVAIIWWINCGRKWTHSQQQHLYRLWHLDNAWLVSHGFMILKPNSGLKCLHFTAHIKVCQARQCFSNLQLFSFHEPVLTVVWESYIWQTEVESSVVISLKVWCCCVVWAAFLLTIVVKNGRWNVFLSFLTSMVLLCLGSIINKAYSQLEIVPEILKSA